jgi:carboxymethylenebutenolidase
MQRWKTTTVLSALALSILALLAVAACGPAANGDAATDSASNGDDDYAERMATEHAGDAPTPGFAAEAAAAGEDDASVETSRVTYATVGGQPVEGYLARPAGVENPPGIVVIHEWWGLNDNIETMARMFAHQGYAALAVDLYGGHSADTAAGARELMSAVDEAAAKDNLRQAYAYLDEEVGAPRIGVIGWCFGGGWSLQTALMLPGELDAAVIYYGRLVTDEDELAKLDTPILGIFGAEDQGIPVASVREFEAALEKLGKPASIHVYDGANHAFANPSGERYQPQAAKDAWQKTTAFFAEHLKGDA